MSEESLYREIRALEKREGPAAALTLGVVGNDPAAQRARLALALNARDSWDAAATAAYMAPAGLGQAEPYVPQPFGLGAVIRAEGDLARAIVDPEVRWQTAERLDLNGHLTWVHDEDGGREEWRPDRSDTPEGRREIAGELARIAREVGVDAPPAPTLSAAAERPTPAAARPALLPPGIRPLRPEERATTSPGLSAPGPGIPF